MEMEYIWEYFKKYDRRYEYKKLYYNLLETSNKLL